jgi:hypothetical protein
MPSAAHQKLPISSANQKKKLLRPSSASAAPASFTRTARLPVAQNLPGNWEVTGSISPPDPRGIEKIGDRETMVVMHNDAVVQGLSELPYVQAREHWGVLTIGTGLGNASFSNRHNK